MEAFRNAVVTDEPPHADDLFGPGVERFAKLHQGSQPDGLQLLYRPPLLSKTGFDGVRMEPSYN
jgi:hypothetical protein